MSSQHATENQIVRKSAFFFIFISKFNEFQLDLYK